MSCAFGSNPSILDALEIGIITFEKFGFYFSNRMYAMFEMCMTQQYHNINSSHQWNKYTIPGSW